MPYLFTALKIAATACIVGAIIGEGPGGIQDGLGRAILTFNQYYITGPEKLWAAIFVAGMLGIMFFARHLDPGGRRCVAAAARDHRRPP